MSNMKRKNLKWDAYAKKISKKRMGQSSEEAGGSASGFLTVQRLSANVEGKCQKYTRIGPLTMVPLGCEATLQNIKAACKQHFKVPNLECDVLAGERGPSYTEVSQIKNWKVLHVRFVESLGLPTASTSQQVQQFLPDSETGTIQKSLSKQETKAADNSSILTSKIPASLPLSEMLKLGRLIKPSKDVVTLQLEEFSLEKKAWQDPFDVKLSLNKESFANGAFRNAYEATGISGLKGRFVLKKYRPDQMKPITDLFGSLQIHTRKSVQMNSLARNFAKAMEMERPREFGESFTYTKVYIGKLEDEFVTVEDYLSGKFCKYINNNGDFSSNGDEVSLKAEAFVHYSYVKSGAQLMVLDIQGVGYSLCDPEIASSELTDPCDADQSILFCCGNLSVTAIAKFLELHKCNKYCELLHLNNK